jgi:hypothetical protein
MYEWPGGWGTDGTSSYPFSGPRSRPLNHRRQVRAFPLAHASACFYLMKTETLKRGICVLSHGVPFAHRSVTLGEFDQKHTDRMFASNLFGALTSCGVLSIGVHLCEQYSDRSRMPHEASRWNPTWFCVATGSAVRTVSRALRRRRFCFFCEVALWDFRTALQVRIKRSHRQIDTHGVFVLLLLRRCDAMQEILLHLSLHNNYVAVSQEYLGYDFWRSAFRVGRPVDVKWSLLTNARE